eukprot:SAG11_NODE_10414_length_833_cov_2.445504_1_plen_133_part_01
MKGASQQGGAAFATLLRGRARASMTDLPLFLRPYHGTSFDYGPSRSNKIFARRGTYRYNYDAKKSRDESESSWRLLAACSFGFFGLCTFAGPYNRARADSDGPTETEPVSGYRSQLRRLVKGRDDDAPAGQPE